MPINIQKDKRFFEDLTLVEHDIDKDNGGL